MDFVKEHYWDDYIHWLAQPAWNPPTHSTRQILQRNRGAFLAKNGTDTWRYQQKCFYNGGQYDHE